MMNQTKFRNKGGCLVCNATERGGIQVLYRNDCADRIMIKYSTNGAYLDIVTRDFNERISINYCPVCGYKLPECGELSELSQDGGKTWRLVKRERRAA